MKKEDKVTVLIDSGETKLPALNEKLRCPDHPKYPPEIGFGLAGGGYGTYTYCTICGLIISKTLEDEES